MNRLQASLILAISMTLAMHSSFALAGGGHGGGHGGGNGGVHSNGMSNKGGPSNKGGSSQVRSMPSSGMQNSPLVSKQSLPSGQMKKTADKVTQVDSKVFKKDQKIDVVGKGKVDQVGGVTPKPKDGFDPTKVGGNKKDGGIVLKPKDGFDPMKSGGKGKGPITPKPKDGMDPMKPGDGKGNGKGNGNGKGDGHGHGHHHHDWFYAFPWGFPYSYPIYNTAPVYCTPIVIDTAPVVVPAPVAPAAYNAPLAASGLAAPGVDLELVDVRQLDNGDARRGPAYRVAFRNNSAMDVSDAFDVALLASTSKQLDGSLPHAMVRVNGIEAGQTLAVDIRLPAEAVSMGRNAAGQNVPFSWLTSVIDARAELPQANRDNDLEMFNRGEIPMIDMTASVR